ncbi:unnamed protein product [Clonostachys rhizophaga]|uniref:Uncharacterized protein n=1 Tax=Clonostachys rhizophaga TaxID=160324 RepID=A0A9N9W723_9HYPO|nr:unnamed protein product [Clonostachys rhizophaga]
MAAMNSKIDLFTYPESLRGNKAAAYAQHRRIELLGHQQPRNEPRSRRGQDVYFDSHQLIEKFKNLVPPTSSSANGVIDRAMEKPFHDWVDLVASPLGVIASPAA